MYHSRSSRYVVLYRLIARADFLTKSLFGMNLSNPLWPPANPGGNKTVNHNDTYVGFANDTYVGFANTSLKANKDAVVDAINDSGPHLWSFKSYWYITVPVTIATIVLPVVAGAMFRLILIAFKRYNSRLRWALPMLCPGVLIAMRLTVPHYIFLIIFGVPLGIFALGMLIRASRTGNQQILWCTFAALFAYSILLDVFLTFMVLTAYLPLTFLILVWIREDIRAFFKFKFRYWRIIRSYVSPLALRLRCVRELFDRHRILRGFVFASAYVAIVVPILLPTPELIHTILFAIPLGILAINRLLRSRETQARLVWLAYSVLYACSLFLDIRTSLWYWRPYGYGPWYDVGSWYEEPWYKAKFRSRYKSPYSFVVWVPVTWLAIVRIISALVRLTKRADRRLWGMTGRATTRTAT